MFGVSPHQLGFDTRVMLAPEVRQILSHLNRPHAGSENMYALRNPALRDLRRLRDTEELLDSQGYKRRALRFIGHLRYAAVALCRALRGVLIPQLLLPGFQPRSHSGFH